MRSSLARFVNRLAAWVGGAALALMGAGCATGQGLRLGGDADTCIAITTLIGGIGGVVAGSQGEGESDERAVGGVAGAAAGAVLGYFICGESGDALQSATIRANPSTGLAPLRVNMSADVIPQGSVARYEWDLGDGASARGSQISHTYANPGTYDVRLELTDTRGGVSTATARIEVQARQQAAPPVREEEPQTPQPSRRRIVLRGLTFPFDSADLSEEGRQIVLVATETLKTQPDVRVRILGHTDAKGTDAYNQALSQRRAEAVRRAMIQSGIQASRIEAIGRGESQPVASHATEAGQRQNRRVEFEIVE